MPAAVRYGIGLYAKAAPSGASACLAAISRGRVAELADRDLIWRRTDTVVLVTKGRGLSARSFGFLAILVGIALSALACSGDDSTTDAGGCTTGSCSEAGPDADIAADGIGSIDSAVVSDAGTAADTGLVSDAAADEGGSTDSGRNGDGVGDTGRLDGDADTTRPSDVAPDSGPNFDAAADTTGSPDAPGDGNGGGSIDAGDLDEVLRLNDIQMEGTHNSYHIETTGGIIPAWAYTHKPLDVQLTMQGARQFELDIHYAGPGTFQVHHVPPDVGSTCTSLTACLGILKTWSDAHPRHAPLVVLIEQKDE